MKDPKIPQTIYHYTDSNGLMGILKSQELWASHFQYLNDPAELQYAFDLASAEAKRRLEQARVTKDRQMEEACYIVSETLADRFPDDAANIGEVDGDTPFVVSFCRDSDNLGMWRSYAGGDGYCIGFDTTILQKNNFTSKHDYLAGIGPNFGMTASISCVTYGEEEIPAIVDRLIQHAHETSVHEFAREATLLGGVKHPSYSEEKEVRLIASPAGCLEAPKLLRSGNRHLIPYLEYEFTEEAIVSITVGPGPYQQRNLSALKLYLDQGGRGPVSYYDNIRLSSVPYIP